MNRETYEALSDALLETGTHLLSLKHLLIKKGVFTSDEYEAMYDKTKPVFTELADSVRKELQDTCVIEFWSSTYPGEDVIFKINREFADSGSDCEWTVIPILSKSGIAYERVSEDHYKFKKGFDDTRKALIKLGFVYRGAIDEDARE